MSVTIYSMMNEEERDYLGKVLSSAAQHIHNAIVERIDLIVRGTESEMADVRRLLIEQKIGPNPCRLITEHPVAIKSVDHLKPRGTKNDNTRSAPFVHACERYFKRPLSGLDLGCAGGGIIFDFLMRGHYAMGLEGSDYSFRTQRAEWKTIPDYLRTCDITHPFRIEGVANGELKKFDVICMWEVLEHIKQEDLPVLFSNVKQHLKQDGVFVGSIAQYPDVVDGVNYHSTVMPTNWWKQMFADLGLPFTEEKIFSFHEYCRGSGNGPMDADFSRDPGFGFHFIAKQKS